jgi:hypothetical protein
MARKKREWNSQGIFLSPKLYAHGGIPYLTTLEIFGNIGGMFA